MSTHGGVHLFDVSHRYFVPLSTLRVNPTAFFATKSEKGGLVSPLMGSSGSAAETTSTVRSSLERQPQPSREAFGSVENGDENKLVYLRSGSGGMCVTSGGCCCRGRLCCFSKNSCMAERRRRQHRYAMAVEAPTADTIAPMSSSAVMLIPQGPSSAFASLLEPACRVISGLGQGKRLGFSKMNEGPHVRGCSGHRTHPKSLARSAQSTLRRK